MLKFVPMTPADINEALALWTRTEGMGLRDVDSPEAIARYLARNPGCSYAVRDEQKLAGVSLAGHDGRRGFLHHVAVAPAYRKQGVGRALVEHCLAALKEQGIFKCHLFVFQHNEEGKKFWERLGWQARTTVQPMSIILSDSENA
jgi:ribosomal protein S18 acetylase RimI-like enzyme